MLTEIGGHVVRNGDLMDGIEELYPKLPGGGIDFVYSDPPWGDGNLKYWRTMNAKMNSNPGLATAPADSLKTGNFLARFFSVVRRACNDSAVVWVEYGVRWRDAVVGSAAAVGLSLIAEGVSVYSSDLPLAHLCFAFSPREFPGVAGYADRLRGTKGMATLQAATSGFGLAAGKSIMDPCCGMGYTARLANRNGMTFFGNELNAKRLAKTIDVLRKGKK